MDTATFNKVVEDRIAQIKAVLIKKAAEYSSDTDRLHNFKVAARLGQQVESPEQALVGMLKKHLVSVFDIVAATSPEIDKYPSKAMRDEKIGDSINYLILLEALLIESSLKELERQVYPGTFGILISKPE